jgi:chromatin segregation and condensation protein Rec8/ScpA/Scc1 (kleisin family)
MDEAADYRWFLDQAHRLRAWTADLWYRTRLFYAELLQTEGIEISIEPTFDSDYFAQKMNEARARRKEERMRRIGEMLAQRSDPLVFDEPIRLDAVQGLTEALNGLVNSPVPIEIIHAFLGREDFDLERFQNHILNSLGNTITSFDDLPPLLDEERKNRVYMFIALVYLFHYRKIILGQEGERLWVRRNEAYEQGSGISESVEGFA